MRPFTAVRCPVVHAVQFSDAWLAEIEREISRSEIIEKLSIVGLSSDDKFLNANFHKEFPF
jgi:hypothetical protein